MNDILALKMDVTAVIDIYITPPLPTGYAVEITDSEMELVIITIDPVEEVEWKSPLHGN